VLGATAPASKTVLETLSVEVFEREMALQCFHKARPKVETRCQSFAAFKRNVYRYASQRVPLRFGYFVAGVSEKCVGDVCNKFVVDTKIELAVRLYKLDSVYTHSLQAPGFNPTVPLRL
jgi:hypothetical protein